jgi:hypothetical protein
MRGVGGLQYRIKWAATAAAFVCTAFGLSACASNSYAGIPLTAGAADPELQALARRAETGDKRAQLELGIRYEEGRGVPRNLQRAEDLYRKAAADSGGTLWVYSPPVGENGKGRVIPVDRGPRQVGLAEAKRRLERLN